MVIEVPDHQETVLLDVVCMGEATLEDNPGEGKHKNKTKQKKNPTIKQQYFLPHKWYDGF